ncbi:MAG: pilus assembly protein PilM [Thermodesulfobacteriota bacterium]|nr:pilus assembly protein PilM [Thermodesulfobacteriota bacterium]
MPGKIIGIDIDSDSVTAVVAEGRLRGISVKSCSRVFINGDEGLHGALKKLSGNIDLKADTYVSTISGEHISFRNLQIPFKSVKKIKQTLSFAVETMIPFPIEEVLVDFTIPDQSGNSEILAASVNRDYISNYLAELKEYAGIDPEILDIRVVPIASLLLSQEEIPKNGLILEVGSKMSTMILYINRRISLIRPLYSGGVLKAGDTLPDKENDTLKDVNIESLIGQLCLNIKNTLHSFENQGNRQITPERIFITGAGSLYPDIEIFIEKFIHIPVERIDIARDMKVYMGDNVARLWDPALMDGALALIFRDLKKGQGFNFRKDEFEVQKGYSKIKKVFQKVTVFLIIILSLLAADFGMDYYTQKKRYVKLDNQLKEMFRREFPGVKRIIDPVHQVKAKINEIKKSAISFPGISDSRKVLDLLKDISVRIPNSLNLRVTRMVVDPETVKIKGETDTFNTVDIIKKGLEDSEYFSSVNISSANLDRSEKLVKFELKLQRAR